MPSLKHSTAFKHQAARRRLALAVPAVLLLSSLTSGTARAMVINPVYDASVTSLSDSSTVISAFNSVAADFARSFTSNVTVNVGVSWGSVGGYALPSTAVGASTDNLYGYFSYSKIKSYLTNASKSTPSDTALATAVANLPRGAPSGVSQYVIPSAEAKVLGIISATQSSLDGSIGFAGSSSGYDFNPADGIVAGTYDFQAVAAHELDEVLGRISGLSGTSPTYRTVFDLFRYTAPAVMGFSYNDPAYFSIDGGRTNLSSFNASSYGGDRGDWLTTGTSSDIQDAFISTGQSKNLTAVDLTGLDVLGYGGSNLGDTNVSSPTSVSFYLIQDVPEPGSLAILAFSLIVASVRRRRYDAATHQPFVY